MTTITLTKARETVSSTIADGLRNGISQLTGLLPDKKGDLAIAGVSQDILKELLLDPDSAQALLALLESSQALSRDGGDWLKTEEAAKRMGFSRPYVAALIDAGEFGMNVSKSEKGHRRVKASAVDQWLRDHRVVSSKEEIAAQLSKADPVEFFEAPTLTGKERGELTKRINEGRNESLKHRPIRKRA